MKILQVGRFPGIRIQRIVQLNRKLGHTTKLLVTYNKGKDIFKTNTDIGEEPPVVFEHDKSYVLGKVTEEQHTILHNTISEFDPDIIHVHNIYNLNYVMTLLSKTNFNAPVVYNDHEFWSLMWYYRYRYFLQTFNFINAAKCYYKFIKFKRWEKRYVPKTSVLTVSDGLNKRHQRQNFPLHSMFISNMPTVDEIKSIPDVEKATNRTAIYIGADFTRKVATRNTGNILATWQEKKPAALIVIGDPQLLSTHVVQSLGYIPHSSIYNHIGASHFGVLPFLPHPFHDRISPNKIYMYMHGGSLPIIPSKVYFPDVPINVPRFSTENELINLVRETPYIDSGELKTIAKKYLVMDIFLDELKTFYENVRST